MPAQKLEWFVDLFVAHTQHAYNMPDGTVPVDKPTSKETLHEMAYTDPR